MDLNEDLVEGTDDTEIEENWEAVSELRDEIWNHKQEVA